MATVRFLIVAVVLFYSFSTYAISAFPTEKRPGPPRQLTENDALDRAYYIVDIYRFNLLSFTDDFMNYYSKETKYDGENEESRTNLKNLFNDIVKSSLNITHLHSWGRPRFLFLGDGDKEGPVMNPVNHPNVFDEEYPWEKIEIKLDKDIKQAFAQELKADKPYDVKKVGKNYIIAIKFFSEEDIKGSEEDKNKERLIKEGCIECHRRINYKNIDKIDKNELKGAIVFEIDGE